MEILNIKTKVVHSQTKPAWNVVGISIPGKHKIARCPYEIIEGSETLDTRERKEAFEHATFISNCFNNSDVICNKKP